MPQALQQTAKGKKKLKNCIGSASTIK